MLKKIICIIAAAIMTSHAAYAADPAFDAVVQNGVITFDKLPYTSAVYDYLIIAGYDADGWLAGVRVLENGDFSTTQIDKAVKYRVLRAGLETDFHDVALTQGSSVSPTPMPTAEPAASAEAPKPTAGFPAAYEKQIDAEYTFSVVTGVETSVDEDNETVYKVSVYNCGEEKEFIVQQDVKIISASDYFAAMTGSDASVLREGDVVFFNTNMRGKIRDMSFIYRPLDEQLITSEEDFGYSFEKLISSSGNVYASAKEAGSVMSYGGKIESGRYQYAFGAVMDTGNGYFTLANRKGIRDEMLEISVGKDTIVYTCDMSGRNPQLSISTSAAISGSYVAGGSGGKDIVFTEDGIYTYALARVVNGIATEVIVYTGCGE